MKAKKTRLTPEMVESAIRAYHVDGVSQTEIARRLGKHLCTIHRIVHGDAWPEIYSRVAAEIESGDGGAR